MFITLFTGSPAITERPGEPYTARLKGDGKRAQLSGITSADEGYHQGSCEAQGRRKVVTLSEQLNFGDPYKSCQSHHNPSSLARSLSAVIAL